jgi:hypothetical protein
VDSTSPSIDNDAIDLAGEVREVTTDGWPTGYLYGATRYADVILKESFSERFTDLITALDQFHPTLHELRTGGGGRTVFVKRFDDSLAAMTQDGKKIWGKQNVTIVKHVELDGTTLRTSRTHSHEIDMFGTGTLAGPLPGIAVEMEWNNKDPFYDRDLNNFQALHREGAIAIGVIVTRGPNLQALIYPTIKSKDGNKKYGQASTHWAKLIPKVNLGGGGECPLLLVGIEPARITGIELAQKVKKLLEDADDLRAHWREKGYDRLRDARPLIDKMKAEAEDLMPPLTDVTV